jgi:hypothetical protein
MVRINWWAPVGGSVEVLECVPGLKAGTLRQWRFRGKLSRPADETVYCADNVLEVALMHEFSAFPMLSGEPLLAASLAQAGIADRMLRKPGAVLDKVLVFYRETGTGRVCYRDFNESRHAETHAAFDHPDAPDAFLTFRLDRFIDRIATRIAAVAPRVRDAS